jgi:dihydrofolate synthase/folylpolyglutamate synthase
VTDTLRTYDAARAALYALVPHGMVLGLEPIRTALARWGDPQRRIPAVHIAGTNGKGSVAAMVDAGLRSAGVRSGLYTSPHLHRFAERIRIDGEICPEPLLRDAIWRVLDGIDAGKLPSLTFFEAATLTAWDAFARAGVEKAVLEVGLGGRLDATTECVPEITAITRIAMDHEARLGNTLSAIAREKAGILKSGVACVLGPDLRDGEARAAIDTVARDVGAPLIEAPRAMVRRLDATLRAHVEVDAASGAIELDLALAGSHQVGNAAVAVGILDRLGVPHDAIREGLAAVSWPARLERIGSTLLDAAHNPDGAQALAAAIERLPFSADKRALVFGASADKDWRSMLDVLATSFAPDARFYCAAALRRAESPEALASHAAGAPCANVPEALERASAAVGADGLVVVCGSIFTVAEARAHLLGIVSDPPVPL